MKSGILFTVGLLAILSLQRQVHAGFVVSSVATISSETSTDAIVNVNVYGGISGSNPIELVSAFGVQVSIGGVTPSIVSPVTASIPSQWSAFNNVPTPILTTNTVTFQGYKTPSSSPHVAITGTGTQPSTLIGSFTFSVSKKDVPQGFSTTVSAATALGPGNIPAGNGFLFQDTGFYSDIATTYNPNTSLGSGTIAAISVVPEPSSLALIALASFGYNLRRRHRATAK